MAEFNPSFECLDGHHLFFEAVDPSEKMFVSWCPWCGAGVVFDDSRLTSDDQPIGWTPIYKARVPPGFHRNLT